MRELVLQERVKHRKERAVARINHVLLSVLQPFTVSCRGCYFSVMKSVAVGCSVM